MRECWISAIFHIIRKTSRRGAEGRKERGEKSICCSLVTSSNNKYYFFFLLCARLPKVLCVLRVLRVNLFSNHYFVFHVFNMKNY